MSATLEKWFGNSKITDAKGRPLLVYHGGRPGVTRFAAPAFFTPDEDAAAWYAQERGIEHGTLYSCYLKMTSPLVLRTRAAAKTLFSLASRAGADIRITGDIDGDGTWDFHSPTIREHSPYDGSNPLDLLYIPGVRRALLKAGYDGVVGDDALMRDSIEVMIPLSPGQIRMVGASSTNPPQGGSSMARKPLVTIITKGARKALKTEFRSDRPWRIPIRPVSYISESGEIEVSMSEGEDDEFRRSVAAPDSDVLSDGDMRKLLDHLFFEKLVAETIIPE